jgi:hypothetical protein
MKQNKIKHFHFSFASVYICDQKQTCNTTVVGLTLAHKPLIESGVTECLSGGFPILMADDLKAKNTDWNSRLIGARGSLLRDYANRNCCLTFGNSSTTAPYAHNATLEGFDVAVAKDFVLPAHLSVCSALCWNHVPILIKAT